MGIKTDIAALIGKLYGQGKDGEKIAMRLIEAGLSMMIDEGDFNANNRIVANDAMDGSFHLSTVTPGVAGGTLPELAAIAGGAIPASVLKSAQEAAQEPQESVSKARSSDGTLALSVAPCRAEIVAWVMSKAEKAKKDGMEGVFFVLQALAGEIEQHLEERQANVAHALREFYADCHARNVKAGWWTDLATGISKKRSVGELFMLFVTEIEEAYRAYVEGSQDDKLPHLPGIGVELGDLQIRLGDFAGALLAGSIVAHSEADNPGDRMFQEVCEIARRYEAIRKTDAALGSEETGDFIGSMDVGAMVVEKLEFNAKRADHQIENRMKADGKRT